MSLMTDTHFDSSLLERIERSIKSQKLIVPSFVNGEYVYYEGRQDNTILRNLPETSVLGRRAEFDIFSNQPTPAQLEDILNTKILLQTFTVDERIEMLDHTSKIWSGSVEYQIAVELISRISSRNPDIVRQELDFVGRMISKQSLNYMIYGGNADNIEQSLGIFDDWIDDGPRTTKRVPYGLIFENLAGNSALMAETWIEDIVMGNRVIIKTGDDFITHLALTNLIQTHYPELAKYISILHFSSQIDGIQNPLYEILFPKNGEIKIDAVGVSGSAQAIESMRRIVPAGIPLFENGPKYSAGLLIFPEESNQVSEDDIKTAIDNMIEKGVLLHEQEACNSIRWLAISGNPSYYDVVADYLPVALQRFAEKRPKLYFTGEGFEQQQWAQGLLGKIMDNEVKLKKPGNRPDWAVLYVNEPSIEYLNACARRVVSVSHTDVSSFIKFWGHPLLKRLTQTVYYHNFSSIDETNLVNRLVRESGFDDVYNQDTPHLVARSHDGYSILRKARLVQGPKQNQ